jgi:hypothetical protein
MNSTVEESAVLTALSIRAIHSWLAILACSVSKKKKKSDLQVDEVIKYLC